MIRAILAAAVILAAGCGDDDGDPLSPAEAESLCEDYCGACDPGSGGCQEDCEGDATNRCVNGDAFRALVECLIPTSCDLDDLVECGDRISATPAHERFGADCRARLADCGAGSDQIAEVCDLDDIKYFSSSVIDDARRCFEEPCTAIEACLEAAVDGC